MEIFFYCVTYIKEDDISVSISIMRINTIESLWKLDVAELLSYVGIHEKTHCFPCSLAVIEIVITIQIEYVRCISQHSRHPDLVMNETNPT